MPLLNSIELGSFLRLLLWAFSGVVSLFLAFEAGYLTEVSLVLMMMMSIIMPISAIVVAISIVPFVSSIPSIVVMTMVVMATHMLVKAVSSIVVMELRFLLNRSRVVLAATATVLPLPVFLLIYVVVQGDCLIQECLIIWCIRH